MSASARSPSRHRASLRGAALALAFALPGMAQALTCTEVGSESLTRNVMPGTNALGPINGPPGFQVRVTTTNTPAIGLEMDGVEGGKFNCTGAGLFSATTQECTDATVTDDGDGAMSYEAFVNAAATVTFTCLGSGTAGSDEDADEEETTAPEDEDDDGGDEGGATTTAADDEEESATTAAGSTGPTTTQVTNAMTRTTQAAAGGQSSAVGTAIGQATAGRLNGGGGLAVSSSNAFLSTMATPGGRELTWNGWLSVERREFSGDAEGNRTDFVLGVDTELFGGNTIAGLFIARDSFMLDDGIVDVTARGLSIGPYFAHRLGGVVIDGHIGMGKPEYDYGATEYEADRLFGGLGVRGTARLGSLVVTPFATVATWREEHPDATIEGTAQAGREISATTGSIGARVDFGDLGFIAPYVSAAADYSRIDDGLGGDDEYTSGRYGLGFATTEGPGTFTFDVDMGEQVEGIDDLGIRLNYVFDF